MQVQSGDVAVCQVLKRRSFSGGLLKLRVHSLDQLPVFRCQPQHLHTHNYKQMVICVGSNTLLPLTTANGTFIKTALQAPIINVTTKMAIVSSKAVKMKPHGC